MFYLVKLKRVFKRIFSWKLFSNSFEFLNMLRQLPILTKNPEWSWNFQFFDKSISSCFCLMLWKNIKFFNEFPEEKEVSEIFYMLLDVSLISKSKEKIQKLERKSKKEKENFFQGLLFSDQPLSDGKQRHFA